MPVRVRRGVLCVFACAWVLRVFSASLSPYHTEARHCGGVRKPGTALAPSRDVVSGSDGSSPAKEKVDRRQQMKVITANTSL